MGAGTDESGLIQFPQKGNGAINMATPSNIMKSKAQEAYDTNLARARASEGDRVIANFNGAFWGGVAGATLAALGSQGNSVATLTYGLLGAIVGGSATHSNYLHRTQRSALTLTQAQGHSLDDFTY